MSSPILQTKDLSKNFGGLCAVDNVNFSIHPGEIIALIGPNGAGKTTFFNLLSGVLDPSGGSIHFKGRDITNLAPHTRCELGLSRTFQKNSLFPDLTVFENLRLGVEVGYGQKNAFWRKADSNKKVSSKVEELLAMMDFQGKALTLASNLSHGDQRLLEVLLGLATKPDLLMLDEPAAGLSPAETHRMIGQIKHLAEEAIGNVIIVEHDMEVVTELASDIYVLHQGQVLCTGCVDDIKCDPQVQEVYLGRAANAPAVPTTSNAIPRSKKSILEGRSMLSLQDIHVYYGKSYILQGASLEVNQGEVLALLGRNGVGKTTTLRAIMGMAPPSRGSIKFSDHELTELPSHRIPRLGIGYVPQGRRIFPRLTVMENIQSAVVVGNVNQENLQEAFDYFPRLRERIKQPGGTLSGGEQQMLAMARAMITNPKLMILDEPTEGLMPIMVDTIRDSILKLNRDKGTTVLLVEQNLDTALAVADRVCVMEKGVIKYSGGVKELDKEKLLAYLGV